MKRTKAPRRARKSMAMACAGLVVLGASVVGSTGTASAAPDWAANQVFELDGPSYNGTVNTAGGCAGTTSREYHTQGFMAPLEGKKPLFLVMPGAETESGSGYQKPVYRDIAREMARRGFLALVVSYDNSLAKAFATPTEQAARATCIFNPVSVTSLIGKLCNTTPWAAATDCSRISFYGHSLGGAVALKASDLIDQARLSARGVKAVVVTGAGSTVLPFGLPQDRVRLLNGSNDPLSNSTTGMNAVTGMNCASSATTCLRTSGTGVGGGWAKVPNGSHNWMMSGANSSPALLSTGNPYSLSTFTDWADARVG